MGALYRSEDMTRCQIFLQAEAAYACIAELGELGLVQFRDLNPDTTAYMRKFVSEVRRCDEMERKLRYLEKEILKDSIPILETGESPDAPQPREMIDLEATFEKLENELREVNTNETMLKKNFLELTELKYILRKIQIFFDAGQVPTENDAAAMARRRSPAEPLIPSQTGNLTFVAGVILREKLLSFERLLWRACRGNVFLRTSEIEEPLENPVTGDQVNKSVFIIFFQGDQLKSRVIKICEGFHATLYPCPSIPQERREMAMGVLTRIEDLKIILSRTQDHRHRVLMAAAKNVHQWLIKVRKIKSIYHTLNLFNLDVTQKCLIAECWCPTDELGKVHLALKRGTEESGSTVPSILQRMKTEEVPPTFFRTNKFTQGFQNIVNAYGIATYQEVNPATFTIITFPFLFGVMFGDCGHGTIMFLFALFLILREKNLSAQRIKDEIFQTFFSGRYIILLMGLFSIYTGLIYNDCFSRSFNIFGSAWKLTIRDVNLLKVSEKITLDPNSSAYAGSPYPFGMDPVWQISDNSLLFLNSFKMKMSVIIGIFQMIFGVCLSLMNHRYFREPRNIYCEFVPQILFLGSIFFYLCVLIFYKWTHYGAHRNLAEDYAGPHCAPSLLIGLINMVMFKTRTYGLGPGEGQGSTSCALNAFYHGQNELETALVVLAILCIPWMLLIKPFLIRRDHLRQYKGLVVSADDDSEQEEVDHDQGHDEKEALHSSNGSAKLGHGHSQAEGFSFGDVFIYQAIHTIEFCLGCVSHTASYLRLWALSLAHAELSLVLWDMVMKFGFTLGSGLAGCVATYVIFSIWAALTVAILVIMEGLSAFLHALRLHWVEFNSKFYHGDGYAFVPFSFELILAEEQEVINS